MGTVIQNNDSNIITVTGQLIGSINGVTIDGTVTGTANRGTGHVTNVYHDIDPEIGQELSRIVLGLTIVCANMAVEVGSARNLDSMVPTQTVKRVATFTLKSHTMKCVQTVGWTAPNAAVVTMEYSGSLPSVEGAYYPIPDVASEFQQTGPQSIKQSGTTQATFESNPEALSVVIDYTIEGAERLALSDGLQNLENANNTSMYDEGTKTIIYNTDVRMLES